MSSDVTNVAPHRGQLVQDYTLTRADDSTFMLSDFRNKQNLVLLVFPNGIVEQAAQVLRALAEKSAEVRENETRVIVVLPSGQQNAWKESQELIVATEESGRIFGDLATGTEAAIYFLDKFREIFHVYRITTKTEWPAAEELIGWIRFVAMQCPECHPPEWPADAL